MVTVLIVVLGLLILQGLGSLVEGIRYLGYVRRSLVEPQRSYTPTVSVIAPCKGVDPGFEQNLDRLFNQDYPDYEIIFSIAHKDDPAHRLIQAAIQQNPHRAAKIVVAGRAPDCSEKITNMSAAIRQIARDRRVLVLVDSDAYANTSWLRSLVGPLAEPQVGATTGYRWYLPATGGFWSKLLSAWNGSVATTLGDHGRNFAWGGATAIRKETFERLGIPDQWKSAASDDYVLTHTVRQAGMEIRFVPGAFMVTREDASLQTLVEFTTRQIIITRVYRPTVWWTGIISHALFTSGFVGGIVALLYSATLSVLSASTAGRSSRIGNSSVQEIAQGVAQERAHDLAHLVPSNHVLSAIIGALIAIYLLGSIRAALRTKAVQYALPEVGGEIEGLGWFYATLWPLVSILFLYNFVRSATTRRITWRGVEYELCSPRETRRVGNRLQGTGNRGE